MKISLTVLEVIDYNDFPLLYTAKDPIGGLYLCLATEEVDNLPQYTAVAISQPRLQSLQNAQIDLRSVFEKPELGGWFKVGYLEQDALTIEPMLGTVALPEAFLPKTGAFLRQRGLLRAETLESVKIGGIAKEAGMNPTLLRQYISGFKKPSPEQARRVQDALHRVGRRLLEVQFV